MTELASSGAIRVFYACSIGYAATAGGFGDCNTDSDLDLSHERRAMDRDHRQEILDFYESYAARVYMADPNKPVVRLLDGDFKQYQEPSQQPSPLDVTSA